MAEINEARNEMRVECPMCPWVLISLASLTCAGMSGYRGGWKTSVGRGRCKGSGRKGRSRADDDAELDERVGGVKWCSTRWWRSETLRCDAPWESRLKRPTEVTSGMTMLAIDEACVSDGCGARRMQLGRWWGCMAVLAIDDGSDGTVSRPEVRSNSQRRWRSTSSSESCQQTV